MHFSALCANMRHLKVVCLKTKAPICAQQPPRDPSRPPETPWDPRPRLNIHRSWKTEPERWLTAYDRNIACALDMLPIMPSHTTSGQPVIWSHDHLLRGQRSDLMNGEVRTASRQRDVCSSSLLHICSTDKKICYSLYVCMEAYFCLGMKNRKRNSDFLSYLIVSFFPLWLQVYVSQFRLNNSPISDLYLTDL